MNCRILFATKNRIAGDALQAILDRKGYNIQLQSNMLNLDQQLKDQEAEIIIFGEKNLRIFNEELSQSLKSVNPKPKLAFLLSTNNAGFVTNGLKRGIDGFVHKESGLADLIKCIKALKDNCTYISPSLSGKISKDNFLITKVNNGVKLTCREEEIILLVKENRTSREIGNILNLSTKTIQNHRQNICNKLGLRGRNKLYEYALKYY